LLQIAFYEKTNPIFNVLQSYVLDYLWIVFAPV